MIPLVPVPKRAALRACAIAVLVVIAAAALLPVGAARAVQGVKLPIEGSELYRLKYAGDLVSINDHCPVRKIRLGERMPPVLVNGRAVGFC